jgi:molecular chaperone GrpE
MGQEPADREEQQPPPDLHTLLSQMVALRQEINLGTKAMRAQQEQNAQTLAELGKAFEALKSLQEKSVRDQLQAEEEIQRPLLKAMVETHDALALAHREVQRALVGTSGPLVPALPGTSGPLVPTGAPFRLPWWARLLGLDRQAGKLAADQQKHLEEVNRQTEQQQQARQAEAARLQQLLDSVLTGYSMSLQRLERTLAQHGVEAITCVGQPFDPETMEAVEVVTEPGREWTEVIQEVRRGYLWRGRVFRFAQVRVARPPSSDRT